MAEPIDYLIAQHLQTALRGMAVASGYHYTVTSVAVKLDPDQNVNELIKSNNGPRPIVILQVKPEAWDYQKSSRVRLIWPIAIHWVGESDPTDDNSRMRTYLRGCADVERAITIDISRGGRAVDTRIVTRTMDGSIGGAAVWAIIDVEIHLYRTFGAPDA